MMTPKEIEEYLVEEIETVLASPEPHATAAEVAAAVTRKWLLDREDHGSDQFWRGASDGHLAVQEAGFRY